MTPPQTEQTTAADGMTPMRKVISLMHISLDGFTAGPNGELDWARVDEETYGYVADVCVRWIPRSMGASRIR